METAMATWREDAQYLFGKNQAESYVATLKNLVRKYQGEIPQHQSDASTLPLSEKDALLITYGDQVKTSGEAPLKTLAHFAERRLKGVVSGIHILPFYPWTSDDGFSVQDYFAIDPALGTWGDVRKLGTEFDLMFDAVFNHMSAQSDWFQRFLRDDPEFRDFFVTVEGEPDLSQVVRPRALPLLTEFPANSGTKKVWTTFSADQVDLNFQNPKVLLATIDALLFYVRNGAKFIRLDAIAFLWKEIGTKCQHLPQTHRVIQHMRAVLAAVAPDVMLITETNVPHADNISYFGDGTNEAQLVYNFALPPLVLHSIATGNAEKLTGWAESLKLPSNQVTFFNFLASHDGIGVNPARGILDGNEIDALVARTLEHGGFISYKHNPDGSRSPYEMNINYFDALSDPASNEPRKFQVRRFICAQAIMLAIAGVPGIYFHSLFGSRGDRGGAESSGIPRRINRAKLSFHELEEELDDESSLRSQVFRRLETLLRARGSECAFSPCSTQEILPIDRRLFALKRSHGGKTAFCFQNVSETPVSIATDHKIFAGQKDLRVLAASQQQGEENSFTLDAYEFLWLVSRPD